MRPRRVDETKLQPQPESPYGQSDQIPLSSCPGFHASHPTPLFYTKTKRPNNHLYGSSHNSPGGAPSTDHAVRSRHPSAPRRANASLATLLLWDPTSTSARASTVISASSSSVLAARLSGGAESCPPCWWPARGFLWWVCCQNGPIDSPSHVIPRPSATVTHSDRSHATRAPGKALLASALIVGSAPTWSSVATKIVRHVVLLWVVRSWMVVVWETAGRGRASLLSHSIHPYVPRLRRGVDEQRHILLQGRGWCLDVLIPPPHLQRADGPLERHCHRRRGDSWLVRLLVALGCLG